MMKMKEVCERTELTEKAIRLYIDRGLIHPTVEKINGRNNYFFSDKDISELEIINALRNADFSLAEIASVQKNPDSLPLIIEQKKKDNYEELQLRERLHELYNRLSIREQGDLSQFSNSLKPVSTMKNTKSEVPESNKKSSKRSRFIIVSVALLSIVFGLIYSKFGLFGSCSVLAFICVITAGFSGVMAFRYGNCTKRAKKLPNRGKGNIIHITEDRGFAASYSRAGSGGAGAKESGIGGWWQFVFLLWSEIRPDTWYPIIHYINKETEHQTATFPYGAFAGDLSADTQIEIAWKDTVPELVLPVDAPWLKKKALVYFVLTILLLALAALLWICMHT